MKVSLSLCFSYSFDTAVLVSHLPFDASVFILQSINPWSIVSEGFVNCNMKMTIGLISTNMHMRIADINILAEAKKASEFFFCNTVIQMRGIFCTMSQTDFIIEKNNYEVY